MRRRTFLGRAAALGAWATLAPLAGCGGDDDRSSAVDDGEVVHILATASHDRLLVKASFVASQDPDPELVVDGRAARGVVTDSEGLFWAFDAAGLRPGRPHTLRLRRGRHALTDAWELATLPAPDAAPRRFRLLAYTCAGGHDVFGFYVPRPIRQRLLERALSFAPDAVVANGDHVYWDLRAGLAAQVTGRSPLGIRTAGVFDRTAPVIGTANEGVLKRAVGPQLAQLYGTRLRGVPVFFLRDEPKPGWQAGWLAQHDRLLAAASAMDRVPLFVSGDIHSIAEGRILRSGSHDFGANPIVSLITGSPGTGVGWPSAARGTVATPSLDLDLDTTVPVQEVNGFHLVDVEPEAITVRHFRWRRGVDPEAAIDTLEPFQVTVHAR